MITLQIQLSDLDYDVLVDQFLPALTEQLRSSGNPVGMLLSNGMSAELAKRIIKGLSQEQKDRLATDLINGNQEKIRNFIEQAAAQKGVSLKITSVQASRT